MTRASVAVRLVRALREGLRERLTLARHLRESVEPINQELRHLQQCCAGCLELTPPYPDEPRLVITVRDWAALQQALGRDLPAGSPPLPDRSAEA